MRALLKKVCSEPKKDKYKLVFSKGVDFLADKKLLKRLQLAV